MLKLNHEDATKVIVELRTDLAALHAELRINKQALTDARIRLVQSLYAGAGGAKALGANEKERDQRIEEALLASAEYQDCATAVREIEDQIGTADADMQNAADVRRSIEWGIRLEAIDVARQILDHQGLVEEIDLDTPIDNLTTMVPALQRVARVSDLPF